MLDVLAVSLQAEMAGVNGRARLTFPLIFKK